MRVAVSQFDPILGNTALHLQSIMRVFDRVAEQGATLAVFPECASTGYVYHSLDEAMQVADTIPGPVADALTEAAARRNLHTVVGMLERGATFLGRSQIVAPNGDGLLEADRTHEDLLVLEIDPTEADRKRMVVRPGEHEFDFFGDRRPELYQSLALEPAAAR